LRVLARIDEQRPACIDLFASRNEVLHLHRTSLVCINEALELTIATTDLSRGAFDV
jgi:hypothetical protein